MRVLFELARYHKPSTIFLDEIDSIMSQRQSGIFLFLFFFSLLMIFLDEIECFMYVRISRGGMYTHVRYTHTHAHTYMYIHTYKQGGQSMTGGDA